MYHLSAVIVREIIREIVRHKGGTMLSSATSDANNITTPTTLFYFLELDGEIFHHTI